MLESCDLSSADGVVLKYLLRFLLLVAEEKGRNCHERCPLGVVVQSLAVSHQGVVAWQEKPKQLSF